MVSRNMTLIVCVQTFAYQWNYNKYSLTSQYGASRVKAHKLKFSMPSVFCRSRRSQCGVNLKPLTLRHTASPDIGTEQGEREDRGRARGPLLASPAYLPNPHVECGHHQPVEYHRLCCADQVDPPARMRVCACVCVCEFVCAECFATRTCT